MMDALNMYINLVRVALTCLALYHVYKREYMPTLSVGAVFALTYLPWVVDAIFGIRMDLVGNVLYIALIVMTIYLGNVLKYYSKFSWWDRLIHFLSGITFVSFGVAIAHGAGVSNRFHVLFFCLTLSAFLHVIWEVLEYASDSIFHTNSQSWQKVNVAVNHQPEAAIQPAGLVDTMNDTIVCMISTVAACAVWWFVLPLR